MKLKKLPPLFLTLLTPFLLLADGPADNNSASVRPVPPPGIDVPEALQTALSQELRRLESDIQELKTLSTKHPQIHALLPDVQIFHKAVEYALNGQEIFDLKEIGTAFQLLNQGRTRAAELKLQQPSWIHQTGLVVRGYRSRIDDSIQPYGLVVPSTYSPSSPVPYRLDFWFHGRGEKLSELAFLDQRQKSPGQFTPPNTFVLHLYGRYCNANKFAGEIDLFEALESVQSHYPIDSNRLVVRGFSMGGAACWQFAVHYADKWVAAAPGAGFSETPDFLKVFQKETLQPTWYEQKLWHWYDCTDYALNLFHCPTVAYSGEVDSQIQAARMMEKALAGEGMQLTHLIGPGMGHRYDEASIQEIDRRINSIAEKGRDPVPHQVRFVTYTLRYPSMYWIHLEGLEHHWEEARVNANLQLPNQVTLTTKNITRLTLKMDSGECPLDPTQPVQLHIDYQTVTAPPPQTDRSWNLTLVRNNTRWQVLSDTPGESTSELRKKPGLQGPIDDAFLDSFLFVRPTQVSPNSAIQGWVENEMQHAITHWRKHFRGDVRIKDDTEITAEDIQNHHLIVWGDPVSNQFLKQIAPQLPLQWSNVDLKAGDWSGSATNHVAAMVYPNPQNPERYVVLNSGFTFREYDYLNNARQVAKLPDWAIIDVRTPPSPRWPGKVVEAGFFDEAWHFSPIAAR